MVTLMRADGLRVVTYLNDHKPAHVHVFGNGEAEINLLGPGDGPELMQADTMTRGEVRRAMRLAIKHHATLPRRWEDIHGRTH